MPPASKTKKIFKTKQDKANPVLENDVNVNIENEVDEERGDEEHNESKIYVLFYFLYWVNY